MKIPKYVEKRHKIQIELNITELIELSLASDKRCCTWEDLRKKVEEKFGDLADQARFRIDYGYHEDSACIFLAVERPETDEERQARIQNFVERTKRFQKQESDRKKKQKDAERKEYERLKKKFEKNV